MDRITLVRFGRTVLAYLWWSVAQLYLKPNIITPSYPNRRYATHNITRIRMCTKFFFIWSNSCRIKISVTYLIIGNNTHSIYNLQDYAYVIWRKLYWSCSWSMYIVQCMGLRVCLCAYVYVSIIRMWVHFCERSLPVLGSRTGDGSLLKFY